MNTNATAQMVTHSGKGCMKEKPMNTAQIAAEAARDYRAYKDECGPMYLEACFNAAIEKATEELQRESEQQKDQISAEAEWTTSTINTQVGYDESRQGERETIAKFHNATIKSAIEKAWQDGYVEGSNYQIDISRAAHASGQDESKAKRTARAIRSIAERAGLKITDDVELAWRDAILYALPAAHASEAKLPRDWNKDLPVITHLTPPAHASEPMHCPHCNASFLPPKT